VVQKFFLTVILVVFFCNIQAESIDPVEENPVVNFGGAPSALVNGSVNVITGDYTENSMDIYIPGPEPLTVERSYVSSDSKRGSLGYGWNKNHHGTLGIGVQMVQYNDYKELVDIGNSASYDSGLGVRMNYEARRDIKYKDSVRFRINTKLYSTGLTNISGDEISGRTNRKNDLIYCDRIAKTATVTNGSGITHKFSENPKGTENILYLQETVKRNRLRLNYKYDKKLKLTGTELVGSEGNQISSINYSVLSTKEFKNYPHLDVFGSNGRNVRYSFTRIKTSEKEKHWFLKSATRNSAPKESYEYEKYEGAGGEGEVRLVRKSLPKNRFIEIKYWDKDKKELDPDFVQRKGSKACNKYRVASQKQPVGTDSTAITTYSYQYEHNEKDKSGQTVVFNAHKIPKKYKYSNNRLNEIQHYIDKTNLYSLEKFYWGDKKGADNGNLITSLLYNPVDTSVQMCRTYTYDDKGNILVERLYGNFSGDSPSGVLMKEDGVPNANHNEREKKTYTYTQDGLNLCLTETYKDTVTAYSYYNETELVASKLIYISGIIVERQFFDYDSNGVMTREICDNGSTTDVNNMKSVTQRKITRILPTSVPVGFPGEVSHYYVDFLEGREQLLKRVVNNYSAYGYLLSEDLYDSTDSFVSRKEWQYDGMGNIIQEKNALGETITYRYDSNKNKVFEQGPCQDFHKEYVYDFSNRLVSEKMVFNDGTTLTNQYRYDYLSNKIGESDIYGNETSYSYDGLNRLVETTKPPIFDVNTRSINQTTKIDLNIFGAITCKVDPEGRKTLIKTNIRGQPTSIDYPDGTHEQFRYNKDGTLRKHNEKNGITTYTEYDYQKRPTKKSVHSATGEFLFKTESTYSAYGLISEKDAESNLTQFEYDSAGRLIRKTKGALETQFVYDTLGRLYKEVNHLGNNDTITKIKLYDVLDRVIEERVENGQGDLQSHILTSYDSMGNKSSIITNGQAGPSVQLQKYNAFGNIIKSTDAEGRVVITQYRYDYVNGHGQCVGYREITDPMGNVSIVIKNSHGKDCEFIKKNAFDKILQKYELYYDTNDNLVSRVETVINPDDSTHEQKTFWEYNSSNNVTRRTEACGTPDQRDYLVTYNEYGQKESVTKADGVQIIYEYDDFGRLSRYYSSAGDIDYSYEYDLLNNPIVVRDLILNTATNRTYNTNGHITQEVLANGICIGFDYDPIGRQRTVFLPDQSCFIYEYSGTRLKSIIRKDKWGGEVYNHQYLEYDLSGKVQSAQLIGGTGIITYDYDLLSRTRKVESKHWREIIAGFDEAGNILERSFEDVVGNSNDKFSYDDLSQLKSESGSVTNTYKNDSVYNRTEKNHQAYLLNDLNQVLSDGNTSYQYDRNGNLTNKTSTTENSHYTYDSLGRLTTVSIGNQKTEYTYDEINRRQTKKVYSLSGVNQTLTTYEKYIYQGKHEIGAVNTLGDIINLRLLGNGLGAEIGAAVAIEIDNRIFAPLHDHNGNLTTLVDVITGDVAECYRYSSFGEEEIYKANGKRQTKALSPWRYSSKRYDDETGYVYYGQRYYDPKLGRWITPDPIGYGDGPNLYAYVRNNPLTNIDLWGEQTQTMGHCFYQNNKPIPYYGGVRKLKDEKVYWDNCYEKRVGGVQSSRYVATAETISRPAQPNTKIVYCNGIMNPYSDSFNSAKYLSQLGKGVLVNGIHNSTHGFPNDLYESFVGLMCFRGTQPSRLIKQEWDDFFANNGPDAVLLHFCHSQGAILTRNAINDYPEELRKRIIVVAIAPAAYISPDLCKEVYHYVSSRDFVPYFDFRGRIECRDTIHYLEAHENAGIWDHNFNSPTYEKVIEKHIDKYYKL